jgi:pyruvate ferredoxin oxidoreductase delta subunit
VGNETFFPLFSYLHYFFNGGFQNVKKSNKLDVTPLSRPKIGGMGKTGFWRTFRPTIKKEKCTRCLLCWIYCPDACIKRGADDTVEIDYEYCKGCGICANECRVGAIEMKREVT